MYNLENRIKRLMDEIETLIINDRLKIDVLEKRLGKIEFPAEVCKLNDNYEKFNYGDDWSEPGCDNYALFKFDVEVPENMIGKKIVLYVGTNKGCGHNMVRPQMLLYVNGEVVQGLDTNHEHYILCEKAEKNTCYTVHIYAYTGLTTNTPYGDFVDLDEADGVRLYVEIQAHSDIVNEYFYNLLTPFIHLTKFENNSIEYCTILNELNESLNFLDLREPHSKKFYDSIQKANDYLKNGFYAKEHNDNGVATLVGHTHIDIAWLWRYEHTKDKAVRSFATALELIKTNKEYYFMSSQAQLYKFVKEACPELYERIKQSVKDGKWEVEGAMWVEPDMNLCSGEYIIRQILYGKKFFKEEFNVDCKVLWLPDVFGYSAALPQILKKSGIKYFMTSKLATNEKNRFPFDTFTWCGIDGSKVLSHLTSYLPGAYNPPIEDGAVYDGWKSYLQKNINDDILVPFGYADGGGGTTQKQIEILKRMQDGIPGIPKVKFGKVGDYFERLEKKIMDNRKLPVWSGEIYYEKHRGTYTSMARVKRQNRKGEILYLNTEWLWSLVSCFFDNVEFPREAFMQGMNKLLINQFHDVLPGTCIREVYEDTDKMYDEVFDAGKKLCLDAISKIADTDNSNGNSMLVFNPYSADVNGYVEYNKELVYVNNVPAKGYSVYNANVPEPDFPVIATDKRMENKYYILSISNDGFIESLYDKANKRNCFIEGEKANKLRIFDDRPGHELGWIEDNWNLDSYYVEKEYEMPNPYNIELACNTGEYAKLKIERNYGKSQIIQTIVMYARSPRIDIKTNIDWKEHSQVLKAEFPVDVNAIKATYEIQFGYIERSTTQNTSWEEAKFEVCAHKWADMSDGGYGVAIINDCKYGYSANGSTLSLTLLRCGNMPNPDADKEKHEFTYSILPHAGTIIEADVVKEAYILNNPLFAVPCGLKGNMPESFSLFNVTSAVLETIKPAEDGNGLILRIYEPYNRKTKVEIICGKNIQNEVFCDLLENDLHSNGLEKSENGKKLEFDIKPFEIVTLRVKL